MKKLFFIAALLLGGLVVMPSYVSAQRDHHKKVSKHKNFKSHKKNDYRYDNDRYDHYDDDRRHYQKSYNQHHRKNYYSHQPKKYKQPRHKYYSHHNNRYAHPRWAKNHRYKMNRHVYFPDYHTFYDPRRNGYVYWQNNAWAFSPQVPYFLINVDLGRARMTTMHDVPLHAMPEYHYNQYYRSYPPRQGSININIPIPVR